MLIHLQRWGLAALACLATFAGEAGDRVPFCGAADRLLEFTATEITAANVDISPDGQRLAFEVLGDIYMASVHGGKATAVTSGPDWDVRPVWSPDGREIAFISDRSGGDQVHVINVDGPRSISRFADSPDNGGSSEFVVPAAEWMPDGSAVVVDGHRLGPKGTASSEASPVGEFRGGTYHWNGESLYHFEPVSVSSREQGTKYEMWRLRRRGGSWEKLGQTPPIAASIREAPQVSRDGRWLVYRARVPRTDLTIPGHQPATDESHVDIIRVRDLRSGEDRVLVAPGLSPGWLSNGLGKPFANTERYAILPDSMHLVAAYGGAFHRINLGTGQITAIPVSIDVSQCLSNKASSEIRVERGPINVRSIRGATMRPDGRQLAFSALRRLYVMDLPGGAPRELVKDMPGEFQPSYSPDGEWLAFVSWSEVHGGHVWRVRSNGGVPERLTGGPGYYQSPTWSPDGRYLAFVGNESIDAGEAAGYSYQVAGGQIYVFANEERSLKKLSVNAWLGHPLGFTEQGERLHFAAFHDGHINHSLSSVGIDGTDIRNDGIDGWLPSRANVEAVPSPDGRFVAMVKHGNLYLAKCPRAIGTPEFRAAACIEAKVTREGALDPRWSADGGQLEWSFADLHYRADARELLAALGTSGVHDQVTPLVEVTRMPFAVPRRVGEGLIALKGARIITMRGDEVIEDGTVVVENGRIRAVGRSEDVEIPVGADVMELHGQSIVPGFIDTHAHMFLPRDLIYSNYSKSMIFLALGITTAKDPSATSEDDHAYSELIDAGMMVGPRIYSADALVRGPHKLDSFQDAVDWARREKRLGATFLKYHTGWNRKQRRWIIDAARESGLNVAAHYAISNYSPGRLNLSTVTDGATTSEHAFSDYRETFGDVARFMAGSGTIINFASMAALGYYPFRFWNSLSKDPRVQRFYKNEPPGKRDLPPADLDSQKLPALARGAEHNVRLLRTIADMGGMVSVGSHGDIEGVQYQLEMWAYARGGMGNHEVLRAATLHGAYALGMQADLGSIEPGKIADILILGKDPLRDIRNTWSVEQVMKDGVLRNAYTLDEIWPHRVPLPEWRMKSDDGQPGGSSPGAMH
ncbi:amidohydrolase family protein [Luteimonas sp. 22616]|uniref:amidohydrolase family protein n=1 Tax=Luteimonas sp. 22616 TaxID=3453951 RepID=UPI003F858F70